jgi:hypothetical protein
LVFGLALDIAGAMLVAWPIVGASVAEIREEGLPRLGGNAWIVLARQSEQRLVRIGFGLLTAGFACQATAYVIGNFDDLARWVAVALILAVAGVAIAGAILLGRGNMPARWTPRQPVLAILDQRDLYEVADIQGVRRLWGAARPQGYRYEGGVDARINAGRWIADCRCNAGLPAWPSHDRVACPECGAEFLVRFPPNWEGIEAALLLRRKVEERNWRPGETLDDLERANRDMASASPLGGETPQR